MAIYSHSKITTFEQCPFKYKLKYIDFIPADYEYTIESFLGNKIHETLQWIYENSSKKFFELDEVINHYITSWNCNFNPSIKVIREDCKAEEYFNKGIKFLVNYFLKHAPFQDNTIATEKKIFINLDPDGKYKIQGYIDRLIHNKENNTFEIHDYKTGSIKSQKELDNDRQLALYSIGVMDTYEKVENIRLIWHFLDYNEEKISERTLEQLDLLKKETIERIKKIESSEIFLPNPGCLCKWCEYRSKCPITATDSKSIDNLTHKCNDKSQKDLNKMPN